MSGFGFEQPSAQPVNPRRVGFDLMQRAQQGAQPGAAPPVRHRTEAAVGEGIVTDKQRVQRTEVEQPAQVPVGTGGPINLNNTSTRAAALAVLDRVMAPDLNTPASTPATIAQVRQHGISEDELQLMRQAGII